MQAAEHSVRDGMISFFFFKQKLHMYIFWYTGQISGSIPTPSEDVINGLWDEKMLTYNFYVLRIGSNLDKRPPR